MGWFKSITKAVGSVFKPVAKVIDPLLPESVKSGLDKIDATHGNLLFGNAFGKEESSAAPVAPTTSSSAQGVGTDTAGQELAAKRLYRLGRFFTSPLGATANASTASQRLFS